MSFLLETKGFSPDSTPLEETLFHCANGYLGVRANFEEDCKNLTGSIHGAYINAFHDTHPIHHPEKLYGFPEIGERILNVTDIQSLNIDIDGEKMQIEASRIGEFHRSLDMRKGIVTRSNTWKSSAGATVEIESRRLASFVHPRIFCLEYKITARDRISLTLESILDGDVENFADPNDPRVSGEGFKSLKVMKTTADTDSISVESITGSTNLKLKVKARHRMMLQGTELAPHSSEASATSASVSWALELQPRQQLVLEKKIHFTDSYHHPEDMPVEVEDSTLWFNELAAGQAEYLDDFWRDSDLSIDGDDHILAGLRFSLYNLLQSAPADSVSGIPAKGLSGEGYEGHYFWDSEIYMLPFFLYTRPEIAKKLLEYRHATLEQARTHARELGHRKGAAYPWRTITGRECSAYYPSGSAQYHINADIAFAIGRYVQATGDNEFLCDYGFEILIETARLWMDIGNFSNGFFHICGVTGPDEYTCMIDDNCYTNRMAGENLRLAAEAWERVKKINPERFTELSLNLALQDNDRISWLSAAENMYIPYDSVLDMNPQNEGFLNRPVWDFETNKGNQKPLLLRYHHMTLSRFQVCKQADTVLADVLLGEAGSGESTRHTLENNFNYYEKITTHDSSLSYAAFAVMALRLGDTKKALEYFRENASLDLDNRHGNTKDGIHAANMGGAWMSFVQGFGGFFPTDPGPTFSPHLPAEWNSLEYRIRWGESTISIKADHKKTILELETGPALEVSVFGNKHKLEARLEILCPLS